MSETGGESNILMSREAVESLIPQDRRLRLRDRLRILIGRDGPKPGPETAWALLTVYRTLGKTSDAARKMFSRTFQAIFPGSVAPSMPRAFLSNHERDSELRTVGHVAATTQLKGALPDATVDGTSYAGSFDNRVQFLLAERGGWIRVAHGSADPSGRVQDWSRQG